MIPSRGWIRPKTMNKLLALAQIRTRKHDWLTRCEYHVTGWGVICGEFGTIHHGRSIYSILDMPSKEQIYT